MSSVLYLYGFVPRGVALPAGGLAGIADAPVELLPVDDFASAFSRVASADFSPGALEARTREIAWVGTHGMAHERVVAWFVDHAEILPAPLFTLYSSEEALLAAATERADAVTSALTEYAGLREWDLKVAYAEPELRAHAAAVSGEIAALDREIGAATPGRRFLLERKRDDLAQREVRRAAHRLADELLQAASSSSVRTRTLPLGQGADEGPVVLNAALLVPADRQLALRERLAERAAELAPLGVAVSYSGPWAPYRFLAPEERLG